MSVLIAGGVVVDPVDGQYPADVLIEGQRIAAIGPAAASRPADRVIDAEGLLIMPGAIDAHSHADARILDDDVQLALLRSGVTTVITGQDGVSYAPGDGRYATEYFGPLIGRHPHYTGGGVAALLDTWHHTTRLNVGYLVPAGTVRHEVLGRDPGPATGSELDAMIAMIRDGLADGALGLSSGLDYVPGSFADAEELAALCRPVVAAGGLYVTHIRGYEENSAPAVDELITICRASGVRAHISHFHARPDLMSELLERASVAGADLSWDAYPYFAGFSLLSMALLPRDLVARGAKVAAAFLRDRDNWSGLRADFEARSGGDTNLGPGWEDRLRIAAAGDPHNADLEGLTLAEAGRRRGLDPLQLAYSVLGDSELTTTTVMTIPKPRTDDDLARQFGLPGACSGSDGIFFGGAPHPRAYGCTARMYRLFGRERGDFSWPELAAITANNAARRYGLVDHGRVRVGGVADLALVDPAAVRDRATFEHPTELSEGVDVVLVRGQVVLDGGSLAPSLAGEPVGRAGN
ncbi:amidohydrolase family protein [Microlunatus sp. Gsoil 973]|uniref:N-acyl-D-amino-acid deacylase family protein n=1 Tax=Microlunatus sp. Gsoil 973 TaxID=2672569 RepID=UPI0012B45069|nr:amidohydrolase family protein [Microlunatus sp. Gsoil 973]QGN34061.1 amidohydrolase family protein [Microlunatus sp. Gsoil 973]